MFVVYLMLCKGWWMLLFFLFVVHLIVVIYLFLMHAFSIVLVSLWFCAIWFVFTIYLFVLVVLLFICFWSLLHVKILTCFFLIHFASFMILSNLDVAFFSCVQLLVTLQGCFVDLHIMFLYFGVSDINLLPHHFSYFFYVFFQFLLL